MLPDGLSVNFVVAIVNGLQAIAQRPVEGASGRGRQRKTGAKAAGGIGQVLRGEVQVLSASFRRTTPTGVDSK